MSKAKKRNFKVKVNLNGNNTQVVYDLANYLKNRFEANESYYELLDSVVYDCSVVIYENNIKHSHNSKISDLLLSYFKYLERGPNPRNNHLIAYLKFRKLERFTQLLNNLNSLFSENFDKFSSSILMSINVEGVGYKGTVDITSRSLDDNTIRKMLDILTGTFMRFSSNNSRRVYVQANFFHGRKSIAKIFAFIAVSPDLF